MENDISELIEYLDKKFAKIDSALATKADKSDIQVLVEIKSDIQNLVETKADKADIQNLLDAIDGYAQKADTYFQEMLGLLRKDFCSEI
jgi:5'-deoxynucleotidase YfbR-like HD superfamily hydrolase